MVTRPRRRGEHGQGLLTVAFVALTVGTFVIGSLYTIATQNIKRDSQPAVTAVVDRTISGTYPCQGTEIQTYAENSLHLKMTPSGFRSTSGDPQLAEPKRSDFGPADSADADRAYRDAVVGWKVRLQGVVDAAQEPMQKKCKEIAAAQEATPAAKPGEQALGIQGVYTVDNMTVQAVGGCGDSSAQAKGAPLTLDVGWDGDGRHPPTVIVTLAGGGKTAFDNGPTFDINGYHVDLSKTASDQSTLDLTGNFYTVGDRLEFNGTYSTLFGPAGCGYNFVARKGAAPTSSP